MGLGAGEIEECGPVLGSVDDPEVDLALEVAGPHDDRALGPAFGQDADGPGMPDEMAHDRRAVLARSQDVDIADRLFHPPQGPGRGDAADAGRAGEVGDDLVGDERRVADGDALGGPLAGLDPPADVLDLLLAHARELGQRPVGDRPLEALEVFDAEPVVDEVDGLAAEPLDLEQPEERLGHTGHDLRVLRHPAGPDVLVDLPGQAFADPGERLEPALRGDLGDVLGHVLEDPRGLAVGHDLEAGLALDLEGVGDPVEKLRDLPVLHRPSLAT